jgi:F0F1-type ATP synthase beta subunit
MGSDMQLKELQVIGPVVDLEVRAGGANGSKDAMSAHGALGIYQSVVVGGIIGATLEVQQLLGDGIVRCVAMSSTDGLRRGIEAQISVSAAPTFVDLVINNNNIAKAHNGVSVFGGVGERTREGNDLYVEM